MALFLNLLTGIFFVYLFSLHSFGSYILKWLYMVKILGISKQASILVSAILQEMLKLERMMHDNKVD